mmetsp:Transcript_16234/g.32379  ORF Transcript_16234/g.32379 Transcript_16234/m.32379 type:complete len:527 (-) Transcript_16234:148-1728(-)
MSDLMSFRTQVQRLGAYPAKDKIDSLTSLASTMAPQKQVDAMSFLLVQSLAPTTPLENRIPVFYVLDSILKFGDPRGVYAQGAEPHIQKAFCESFAQVGQKDKTRLYRLLQSWEKNPGGVILPRHTPQLRAYLNPWLEGEVQRQQTQQAPLEAKRARVDDGTGRPSSVNERALVDEMRRLLDELQHGLPGQPMTLEELWQTNADQARQVRSQAHANLATGTNGHNGGGSGGGATSTGVSEEEKAEESLAAEVRSVLSVLSTHAAAANIEKGPSAGGVEAGELSGKAAACAAASAVLLAALHESRAAALTRAGLDRKPPLGHGLGSRSSAAAAARQLSALPCVCAQDALRFQTPRQVAVHLEVVDGRARAAAAGGLSRAWAQTQGAWIAERLGDDAEGGSGEAREGGPSSGTLSGFTVGVGSGASSGGSSSAPAAATAAQAIPVKSDEMGGAGLSCRLCGEKFETYFDDDREQWMYRDARELEVVDDQGTAAMTATGPSEGGEVATVHSRCAEDASLTGTVGRSLVH